MTAAASQRSSMTNVTAWSSVAEVRTTPSTAAPANFSKFPDVNVRDVPLLVCINNPSERDVAAACAS